MRVFRYMSSSELDMFLKEGKVARSKPSWYELDQISRYYFVPEYIEVMDPNGKIWNSIFSKFGMVLPTASNTHMFCVEFEVDKDKIYPIERNYAGDLIDYRDPNYNYNPFDEVIIREYVIEDCYSKEDFELIAIWFFELNSYDQMYEVLNRKDKHNYTERYISDIKEKGSGPTEEELKEEILDKDKNTELTWQ